MYHFQVELMCSGKSGYFHLYTKIVLKLKLDNNIGRGHEE